MIHLVDTNAGGIIYVGRAVMVSISLARRGREMPIVLYDFFACGSERCPKSGVA